MAAVRTGDKLAAQGRWDEALNKYSEAYERAPQNKEFRLKMELAKYETAMIHFKKGSELLEKKDYDRAILEFQFASTLNPSLKRANYLIVEAKKRKDALFYYNSGIDFLKSKKSGEAAIAFKRALSLDPALEEARQEMDKLKVEKKTMMGGYELNLKSEKPITLKFKDTNIKDIFDIIAKLSGISFIFDDAVKKQRASIYIEDATFNQALELLLMTNKLFKKVVNENTIIIIPDTKQKRQQYQDLMIHTFYLSNLEAKKAVNLLRTLLQIKSIYVNEALNTIVIRDTPEVIELAQKLLAANDLTDAEIMLEVEILEIQKSAAENLGLNLSKDSASGGLFSLDKDDSLTYNDLKNASMSDMVFTIPDIIINLQKSAGNANLLANPKIRVANEKKAKIHIGDRVPIITSTVNNGVTTENVQYVDIGVKLNVEPVIHLDNEVTLKISLEISSLGKETKTAQSTVYQIGTRNAETELRLYNGETQVIGGLINDTERETIVKIPFFGDIPVLGRLFSSVSNSASKTDIVLSLTPHIIRGREVADAEITSIWSGRAQEFSSKAPFEEFAPDEMAFPIPEPGQENQDAVPGGIPVPLPPEAAIEPSDVSLTISGPQSVVKGENFTISIDINSNRNVVSVPFYLRYDQNLVSFIKASEGDFMKQDGKSATFLTSNDAKKGRLIVGNSRLGDRKGISGSGQVMTVDFQADSSGQARFFFENYRLIDGQGKKIETKVFDKTINII
ncbi:MAG: cohesin domain-containing protein [Deltaproteobacteria bacterium]|nr:cohesin domain-containing protein [Deltaproteobacteria bacterium]